MEKQDIFAFINNKAVDKNGVLLLDYSDIKTAIEICRKTDIDVLGIDVFSLNGESIQPHSDKSIDFSSCFGNLITPSEYLEQLVDGCEQLFFEITI